MRVADVHAHIFPDALAVKAARSIGDFYDIESENLASVGRLLEAEKEAGICTTLVCNSAVSAHQAPSINAFVGETVAQNPEFLGLGSVFPGMEDWQGELERVKQLGLCGIIACKNRTVGQRPIHSTSSIPKYSNINYTVFSPYTQEFS